MPDEASVRMDAAAFALKGKGYVTTGAIKEEPNYLADTWVYYPETDLWVGDSDDDFTPFEGTSRSQAVAFSTGTRGFDWFAVNWRRGNLRR